MVVDLYAIINDGQPMEMYVRDGKSRKDMESLLNHILKKIQNLSSKIIRTMTIHTYSIYYFGQASFIFILATESKDRPTRMQDYLRIVADIFYDSYDERKFHYVLDRIMEEINRTEFGGRNKEDLEDDDQLLPGGMLGEKQRLSVMVQRRQSESKRAYAVMTLLFLIIMALGVVYLRRKWN